MKKSILFIILMISIVSCKKENKIAEIGKQVPNYTFKSILNSNKKQLSIRNLKGKIIILEFWATWCGPCIPAMKKLDSLQAEFKDDLEVIAISSENKERLEKFIKSTNTNLKIVSDTSHISTFKYKVIPHSIIIDRNGVVRAITSPENINKEVLNKLISKNEISLNLKDDFYIDPTLKVKTIKSISNPDYTIELKSFEQQRRGIKYLTDIDGENNGIEMWNRTIPALYMTLFDLPSYKRIIFKDSLSKNDFPFKKEHRFSLRIQTSKHYKNDWKQLGITILNENFDVNAKMNVDTLDCYVLKNIDHIIKESNSAKSEYMFMGTIFKTKKIKMSQLAEYLENFTSIPVLDKTNLNGKYDIEFEWQEDDPKTLYNELKKYGLKIEKSNKKLPVEIMEIYRKK